jgi:hypothetical protein
MESHLQAPLPCPLPEYGERETEKKSPLSEYGERETEKKSPLSEYGEREDGFCSTHHFRVDAAVGFALRTSGSIGSHSEPYMRRSFCVHRFLIC